MEVTTSNGFSPQKTEEISPKASIKRNNLVKVIPNNISFKSSIINSESKIN